MKNVPRAMFNVKHGRGGDADVGRFCPTSSSPTPGLGLGGLQWPKVRPSCSRWWCHSYRSSSRRPGAP